MAFEPGIAIAKNGPRQLTGVIRMKDDRRNKPESKEPCAFWRYGESGNKPFCDGTPRDIDFDESK